MELMKAHEQWKNRPADERYPTVLAAFNAAVGYRDASVEKDGHYGDLRAEAVNGDIVVRGRQGIICHVTNWAFGQLAARIGAPASYLRDLPASLAVQNINHGLSHLGDDSRVAKMLFHKADTPVLRALTSDRYERIWNAEVLERLLDLGTEWVPATPDIRAMDTPLEQQTALYVSDHDMFAFLRSPNNTVFEAESQSRNKPIYRGVIVENSEVGASALKLTRFLYNEMCGNHIIWGASNVVDMSVRHIGDARERWATFAVQARQWSEASATDEEVMIDRAKHTIIAGTKEDVLDAIFGKRIPGLSRKVIDAGYESVKQDEDGAPGTVWGMTQGLTRYSQSMTHTDERTKIDKAAGKLLEAGLF